MSLRLSLVIDGNAGGAKQALDDTASGIQKIDAATTKANPAITAVGEGLSAIAQESDKAAPAAEKAAPALEKMGEAASSAGGKFGLFKTLAIGAVGGVVGALASAGFEALIGGVVGAFSGFIENVVSSGPQVKAALESHEELIKRIKGAYQEAAGAASSYGTNSAAVLTFDATDNVTDLQGAMDRQMGELENRLGGMVFNSKYRNGAFVEHPLETLVKSMRSDLKEGTADVIAFRNSVAELGNALPSDDNMRPWIRELLADTKDIANTQAELTRGTDILKGLSGDADAAATALGGSAEKYGTLGTAAGAATPALTESAGAIAAGGAAAADALPAVIAYGKALADISGGAVPNMSTANPKLGLGLGGGASTPLKQFSGGGSTGDGAVDEIAGFVHGKEYVFDAEATARIGVDNLEAIRRGVPGFASGGYVGTASAFSSAMASSGGSGSNPTISELLNGFEAVSGAVNQFVRDLWQTKSPLEALGSVVASVSQNYLNGAIGNAANFLGNAAGNWLSGALGGGGGGAQLRLGYQAGVMHQGGTAGQAGGNSRFLDASMLMSAPNLRGGLASNEYLTVLEEGETVTPRGGRSGGNGGGSTVNYWNIETPSPRAFMESRASLSRNAGRLSGSTWRHS